MQKVRCPAYRGRMHKNGHARTGIRFYSICHLVGTYWNGLCATIDHTFSVWKRVAKVIVIVAVVLCWVHSYTKRMWRIFELHVQQRFKVSRRVTCSVVINLRAYGWRNRGEDV